MIIIIVSIFSFLLEYLFNLFFHGTIFSSLIVFSSIILLQPYFKNNKFNYFLYCFVVGFLYDYIYTGLYFMNAGIFLLIGVIVLWINSISPNNFFVSILEIVFLICLYRFFSFLFLYINGFFIFDFGILFKAIYSSLLLNVIYGICIYLILYMVSCKFNIKRIN
jgi:cell shape-determining protein MreD